MSTAPAKPDFWKLFLLITLPLYVLDQVTKWWVVFRWPSPSYVDGSYDITVIEGFFNIIRVHNQGVAFGFGNGTAWAPVVFLIVPLLALGFVTYYWKTGGFAGKLGTAAALLLVTGILGNLTDRLFQGFFLEHFRNGSFWERLSEGYVVDFLDFTIPLIDYRWPSFNVADACVCCAAGCLFIMAFKAEEE